MKQKIDPSKKYTSGGHPVEFLHRAPEGWPSPYIWRGIVNEFDCTWNDEGIHDVSDEDSFLDLIEVREPLELDQIVDAKGQKFSPGLPIEWWDKNFPTSAPHTLRRFREVIE